MAQQGEQMRVGAREGFAYHSVKLVLLANGRSEDWLVLTLTFLDTRLHL